MKNNTVKNLKVAVPVEIRLEVYENTLSFIENKGQRLNVDYKEGLCIILPVILWGMESMFEKTPDGSCWSWRDTTTAFPEFKKRDIERIHKSEKYLLVRKNILKRCINTLNKII